MNPTSSLEDTDIQDMSVYLGAVLNISGVINAEEQIAPENRIMTPDSIEALNLALKKNLAAITCIVTSSSCQSSET